MGLLRERFKKMQKDNLKVMSLLIETGGLSTFSLRASLND